MGAKAQRDVAFRQSGPSLILGWGVWKNRKCGFEKNRVFMASLEENLQKTEFGFRLFRKFGCRLFRKVLFDFSFIFRIKYGIAKVKKSKIPGAGFSKSLKCNMKKIHFLGGSIFSQNGFATYLFRQMYNRRSARFLHFLRSLRSLRKLEKLPTHFS